MPGWLTSDFDNRDPRDDLSDVEGIKSLEAQQDLPQHIREMWESTDHRVQVDEMNDRYRITKIVTKRDPEHSESQESYHCYNKAGKRIPLTEKEYDELLGISHSLDDMYEALVSSVWTEDEEDVQQEELELESLESSHNAPMDRYDLTFDATEAIREAKRSIEFWNEGSLQVFFDNKEHFLSHIQQIVDSSYSANWYPARQDKRVHGKRAKSIIKRIECGELSDGRAVATAIGQKEEDMRPIIARNLKKQAMNLPNGPQKVKLMKKAQFIMNCALEDKRKHKKDKEVIRGAEREKIWSTFNRKAKLDNGEELKLTSWQYQRIIGRRLRLQVSHNEISEEGANLFLNQKMQELYPQESEGKKFRIASEEVMNQFIKPKKLDWLEEKGE